MSSLREEAANLFDIKRSQISLEMIQNARKVAIAFFGSTLLCMFIVASAFTLLFYFLTLNRFNTLADISLPFIIIVSAIGLISAGTLFWALHEKTWMKIFKVKQTLERISIASAKNS